MKFLKDRARIINIVNDAIKTKDYPSIYRLKEEILKNIDCLLDTNVLDYLVEAAYFLGAMNKVILLVDEYAKHDYESYECVYYYLLANVSNIDIYQAVAYIKHSTILNKEDAKVFFINDGANYTNILYIEEEKIFLRLALIMVNFILGISKEMLGDFEVDKEFLLYRFFDMINMVYEIGYPEEIIVKLSEDMRKIFMLEI